MLDDPRVNLVQFTEGVFPTGDPTATVDIDTQLKAAGLQDAAALAGFIRQYLEGRTTPAEAVVACLGVRLGAAGDLAGALAVDAEVDAMYRAPEAREASQQRGRQALQLGMRLVHSGLLLGFSVRAEAGSTPCHHALVFGVIGGVLGWSARAAAHAYLQGTASMIVAAAVRLRPFAPGEALRVVWSLDEDIAKLANKAVAAEALAVSSYTRSGQATLAH